MNTLEIDRLLAADEYSREVYGGTFARDTFDQHYAWSSSRLFVVNTDPSTLPGEHWLAVFRGDVSTFLFDSYGLSAKLFYPEIVASLTDADTAPPIASSTSLQSPLSDVCGDYCVLFGLSLSRGISFNGFLNYWTESYPAVERDVIVRMMTTELAEKL